MQLGCVQQAAGMLKQGKELRGQTQALTWAAQAVGKRYRWGPQGLLFAAACALSRPPCSSVAGRGTFFEASIPDWSINAHAAAPAAHSCCCMRVHGVVRPLVLPVHLNQIYLFI